MQASSRDHLGTQNVFYLLFFWRRVWRIVPTQSLHFFSKRLKSPHFGTPILWKQTSRVFSISKYMTRCISGIPFSVSFSHREMFFFLLFSENKKTASGLLWPNTLHWRFRSLKIHYQASERLICAIKESSLSSFFLMFIVNLPIMKRLFTVVTMNITFK